MAKSKKNLNRKTVRLLRKIQKFLIAEPRRFNMYDGITDSTYQVGHLGYGDVPVLLEAPPCGTACCIAGAGYIIDQGIPLNHTTISWGMIHDLFLVKFRLTEELCDRLFYTKMQAAAISEYYSMIGWSEFYSEMYRKAKTPLERACVGVARIEHFIATDGQE